MDLYNDIKELKNKSLAERKSREDDRWVAPYYTGLKDFKIGQNVWCVGTVGEGCDNRIWQETITGELEVDEYGYLCFITQGVDINVQCCNRFNSIGCSIFFTKVEAEIALSERIKEVKNC